MTLRARNDSSDFLKSYYRPSSSFILGHVIFRVAQIWKVALFHEVFLGFVLLPSCFSTAFYSVDTIICTSDSELFTHEVANMKKEGKICTKNL
jgi:hypothetical protein